MERCMTEDIMTGGCEMCGYYEYDEEDDNYYCTVNLDEDEMYRFVTGRMRECPYFQYRDEYRVVRKQM